MPTFVDPNTCNACAGEHQGPLCVYICPNDLMALDTDVNKGFNQEPDMCSECYACVKLCPQEAINVRGYADFVPMGAIVQPHRTAVEGLENGGPAVGSGIPRRAPLRFHLPVPHQASRLRGPLRRLH